MTYYIKSGNTYHVSPHAALDIREHLPVGTYIVKFDEQKQIYYLELAQAFGSLPKKVYGDTTKTARRILNTYADRGTSTGVLLAGEKGSGKTMLAKMLSTLGSTSDIPTLIINSPFCGDGFNKFIQDIDQNCIVLFDEFEKIYDVEDQEQLLTLLDGVFPQKKLFVFTCNDMWLLNKNLINRPGRIFYMLEYSGLDEAFIREYLNDNLDDKTQIEKFVSVSINLFSNFNFDMMMAMVQEMNRYKESIGAVLKFVNAKPCSSCNMEYSVTVTQNGREITKYSPKIIAVDIYNVDRTISIYVDETPNKSQKNNGMEQRTDTASITNCMELELMQKSIISMDLAAGTYIYACKGYHVTLTKLKARVEYSYLNALNAF